MTLAQLTVETWCKELSYELNEQILGYWKKHAVDENYFGFIGEIRHDGIPLPEADKGLVLHARILWTFAASYRNEPRVEFLTTARRAYDTLKEKFADIEHGGLYWMIDVQGKPVSDKKQIYGQAFVIYALAEYVRATQNKEALEWAKRLYGLIEKHAYDPINLGYVEALARNWSETPDLSLSGKDLNERKSMNTHLHVLEAYTNLYRIWKPAGLKAKLKELIEVHLELILDSNNEHFLLFFDDEWQSKSEEVSYGHDIEGSWLLYEAAEVLGDAALIERVKYAALNMAEATLKEGVDKDGGVFNEFDGEHLDDTKDWWPQAEAMVGFYNAWELSGEQRYLDAARASWSFITRFVSDREHGEWHWQLTREGKPFFADDKPKVGAWKCPYHNSRACLEVLERIERSNLGVKEPAGAKHHK